ncbi:uncharacterized protein FPOAC1_013646 [Fusarium poae]|uniref:uncharacterized protein n=1 Tax=Fusarium poae TaxID=36050 RepID=UPI001D04B214|nr:uncharacterized protein FPOAC1_013646 [Fusarium poae]KAG8664308.1 hypothetical protein FPOAC1_013646 [Fusarium poae]
MWYLEGDSVADPTTTFIEGWIRQIEEGNPPSGWEDGSFDIGIMSRSGSPKKPRTRNLAPDPDATPRQKGAASFSDASLGYASSESGSNRSIPISSGSSSPRKRELELRNAKQYPLQRKRMTAGIAQITPLMQDLAHLINGPTIPYNMKARITMQESFPNPPLESWFMPPTTDQSVIANDEYIYRRLRMVRRRTAECEDRLSHESTWNDSVHSPLLEVALYESEQDGVSYENITQCRIYPGLRDPDPFITDARIDYGIFFEPREDSSLYSAIKTFKARNENNRVAHVQLTDERDTPLAISIETKNPKSTGGGVAGPAQLGTWVRAHFRHLESLPRADPDNLPMLPIIFVNGADWRVDFAQRTPDKLIIWESIQIGSTDSSHGCYAIIAALQRLAGWCRDEYAPWWEKALAGLEGPV